jgi:hypothetical protein
MRIAGVRKRLVGAELEGQHVLEDSCCVWFRVGNLFGKVVSLVLSLFPIDLEAGRRLALKTQSRSGS